MTQDENGQSTGRHDPSDEELMSLLAAGHQEALGPLHGRYASLIFSIAARSLGHDSAEEIVQDVFVAVWRKAASFDPMRGTFSSWALRIAHLRVLNELRRRGRRPQVEPDFNGAISKICPNTARAPRSWFGSTIVVRSSVPPSMHCRSRSGRL